MSGHITIGNSIPEASTTSEEVDASVPSPTESVEIIGIAVAAEAATGDPVVEDTFIPFTETVFESLEDSTVERERSTTESVAEEFGGRLAGVFRGLQGVRKMISEGNLLGAAQRLARIATVSRTDASSLSRFHEARILLHYTESAQRSLASGDVDSAVMKLEQGMGEVAAGAQDTMSKSKARSLVRGVAKIRAAASDGDYSAAIARTRQMIGRFGNEELDDAFARVVRTLETIDQLRGLRATGFSGRLVSTSRYGFTQMLDGLRGVSRFATGEVSAAEPREIDESEPVDFATPKPN